MAKVNPQHPNTRERVVATRLAFSLDWWSVIVAGIVALLALAGILPNIPW